MTPPLRFLLTNDDGIDAPGLAALDRAVASLGSATIVAPKHHLSGCSHQATTFRPLELTGLDDRRHALDGTPVDCARVGLAHLPVETDWVLSGINEGGNLGADVYMSGTVAAAREAALLGKPGIAISQYRSRRVEVDWDVAADWCRQIVERLISREPAKGSFWNVNLPHFEDHATMPEVVFCPVDPSPMPIRFVSEEGKLHYRATYQERERNDGCDVAVCFEGCISISELSIARPSVS